MPAGGEGGGELPVALSCRKVRDSDYGGAGVGGGGWPVALLSPNLWGEGCCMDWGEH
jgi:hypothetical protein